MRAARRLWRRDAMWMRACTVPYVPHMARPRHTPQPIPLNFAPTSPAYPAPVPERAWRPMMSL